MKYAAPALLALMLTACGGGASGISNAQSTSPTGATNPTAQQETINGIPVPPDPGGAKDATVVGIDTDHNGIRDEIDRWIATQYGNKPGALQAIRLVAKSDQDTLTANVTTHEQALSVVYASIDWGACTGDKLRQEGLSAGNVFDESFVRTYNTQARIDARKKIFSLAGMIVRDVNETTINCPFPQ